MTEAIREMSSDYLVEARGQYRPYPTYVTAIEELNVELPAHWEVRRLKQVADVNLSNVDKKSDDEQIPVRLCNYVDVYHNDFIVDSSNFMRATATAAQVRRFELKAGDVIITKDSESWDDIAVPALVRQDLPGVVCGYHLAHIRPTHALGGYLFRAISADGVREQFMVAANGITRYGLSGYDIVNALVPVPPLPEQRAIADFLDRETGRIDSLIEKKKRLIELLEEKRSALISHAVTKGLNPDAPMKPSGIDWLGDIPEHWQVKKLKHCLSERMTYGANEAAVHEDKNWPRFVRITDVDERGRLREETFKSLPPDVAAPYILQDGDLLFARSGATVGKVFQYRSEWGTCCFAGYLIRGRPNDRVLLSDFLKAITDSSYYSFWKSSIFIQATIQNISAEKYGEFCIPLPPAAEQRRILTAVRAKTMMLRQLVDRNHQLIDKLKERRTAVISAAVTGKINVGGGQRHEA